MASIRGWSHWDAATVGWPLLWAPCSTYCHAKSRSLYSFKNNYVRKRAPQSGDWRGALVSRHENDLLSSKVSNAKACPLKYACIQRENAQRIGGRRGLSRAQGRVILCISHSYFNSSQEVHSLKHSWINVTQWRKGKRQYVLCGTHVIRTCCWLSEWCVRVCVRASACMCVCIDRVSWKSTQASTSQ